MMTTTRTKKVPPISIFMPEEERRAMLDWVGHYATLTASKAGRIALEFYKELVDKRGMDPHTMRPKGF